MDLWKSPEEIFEAVVTNVHKMLVYRRAIPENQPKPSWSDRLNVWEMSAYDQGKIVVLFVYEELGKKLLTSDRLDAFLKESNDNLLRHRIAILMGDSNRELKKSIKTVVDVAKQSGNFEYFYEWQFMMNLLDHVAISKHEISGDTDCEELMQRNKAQYLPKMLSNDPVAAYLGLNCYLADQNVKKKFRLIRIERDGRGVYYRVVPRTIVPVQTEQAAVIKKKK